jgi:hypothetical protein
MDLQGLLLEFGNSSYLIAAPIRSMHVGREKVGSVRTRQLRHRSGVLLKTCA